MPEVQLVSKTFQFKKTLLVNVQLKGDASGYCVFHVTSPDSVNRGAPFYMTLIIGANSPNGKKAQDTITSGPAFQPMNNDGKKVDFKWRVPAGTYTLLFEVSPDHKHPNAEVKADITIACDPGGKLLPNAPLVGPQGPLTDPHAPLPDPNTNFPGYVHGTSGGGAGVGSVGTGTPGGSGTGTSGTGSSGSQGTSGNQHLGPDNPGSGGPPGQAPGGPAGTPEKPQEPEAPPKAGGPATGPVETGPGGGPATGPVETGPNTQPGGGTPTPEGGGTPTDTPSVPVGPPPKQGDGGGTDPKTGNPTDPGGPPPGDPPAPGDPGGPGPAPGDPPGPGDPPPPPPPPSYPPDWVTNIVDALGTVQAVQVGAAASGSHEGAAAALTAGVALGSALAGVVAGLGVAGAVHVEAHVGHFPGHAHAAPGSGAPSFGFVYVPAETPAQSIRLREPRRGATEIVKVHGNGLLVYRSELAAEAAHEKRAPVVHGRLTPKQPRF